MNLGHLFRVETLDTRFCPRTPDTPLPHTQPSRWRTREYYLYYLCFLTVPILMFKAVYDVSQPSHPNYATYEHLLEPGWIPGRKVDNSDSQYSSFRNQVPTMLAIVGSHLLLRRVYEYFTTDGKTQHDRLAAPEARLRNRVTFDLAFAAAFVIAMHGVSALKILIILYLNYQVATAVPKKYAGVATWAFNIGILFANELCRGYRFASMAALFLPPQTTAAGLEGEDAGWGLWLDGFAGLVPRWEILFNITVLRLISFNFDYLWSLDRRAGSPIEKKNLDPATYTERDRIALGAQPADFTFRNYLAYVLYTPLYLIGPILTFNDYIAQSRQPLPSTSRARLWPYALRFALCFLAMELILHHLYAVAISKSHPDWSTYTPLQLSMLAYFNLHIIWLKLLIPWRFFRLWALTDTVDPPENMLRCMSNNYSALAFWRGWHRSFNRWIIRYLYVPLLQRTPPHHQVSKLRQTAIYATVFTFVALWHDINLKLLLWGWLVVLFILPEVLARLLFPAHNFAHRPTTYRYLSALGAVANILTMMAANLVGFAVGLDGLTGLVHGIVSSSGGRVFLLGACAALFVGVQVMFEWRAAERRRGVEMKC
ncbi:hypothetical protein LTR08_008308 [Meristemomyces frigidus]|nr:hypothetical protein LTR08_008308 [Meristemomyces frigidus]